MMKVLVAAAAVGVVAAAAVPAAQVAGRGSSPPRAAAAKPTSARILVRAKDGETLSGVRLLLSGDSSGEFVTGAAGTAIVPNLKDGMYRVRCERDGFITLEREFTLRGAVW